MLETVWAILLAAGKGKRMIGATQGKRKQFIYWRQRPLYWHSLLALARGGVDGVIIMAPWEDIDNVKNEIAKFQRLDAPGLPILVSAGGNERYDSVYNGLGLIPKDCVKILIHDAARPFATPALTRKIISAIDKTGGAVPGVPVADTIKIVEADQAIATPERNFLRAIQTPQGFKAAGIIQSYNNALRAGWHGTDDASFWEWNGGATTVVPGELENIKITNPEDLIKMRQMDSIPEFCSGFGYDAHRYGGKRPLRLGGILIPGDWTVHAHSDGDVLLHSLMDALLGLGCFGDIGKHFPDSDPQYAGISSAVLLDDVLAMLEAAHIRITHVDMTVVAQKPRLSPYADQIQKNVARLLSLADGQINFKATTEEGMGFTGSCEGIKAFALVSGMKLQEMEM